MSSRKKISFKTKLCATLMLAYNFDYKHAKELTEDQFLSLFQFDHNMLHESGHEHVDKFWNLTPMWIPAHREKTQRDAVIIAKGRRIRRKLPNKTMIAALDELDAAVSTPKLRTGPDEFGQSAHGVRAAAPRPARSRLRSRGFDKTLRRKVSGKVEKR